MIITTPRSLKIVKWFSF